MIRRKKDGLYRTSWGAFKQRDRARIFTSIGGLKNHLNVMRHRPELRDELMKECEVVELQLSEVGVKKGLMKRHFLVKEL